MGLTRRDRSAEMLEMPMKRNSLVGLYMGSKIQRYKKFLGRIINLGGVYQNVILVFPVADWAKFPVDIRWSHISPLEFL
jgi:hypothetical protein